MLRHANMFQASTIHMEGTWPTTTWLNLCHSIECIVENIGNCFKNQILSCNRARIEIHNWKFSLQPRKTNATATKFTSTNMRFKLIAQKNVEAVIMSHHANWNWGFNPRSTSPQRAWKHGNHLRTVYWRWICNNKQVTTIHSKSSWPSG